MASEEDEEERLRSVALQNAQSIHLARQRAEDALRKQSEWLRVTLASIGDAVISTDAESRITFMNGVAESLTGWSQSEALGRPLPDVFHIVNETSRQPVENPALRALREGMIVGLANHTILIAKDGSEWPIDDSAAPIRDEAGNVSGAVLVFRDITERKRQEVTEAERNRLMALRADVSMLLASAETIPTALQHCCEALVRHLGMSFARVWTMNETDDVLELQASAGQYTHLDGSHSRVKVGEFKIGRIAANRQPHLTNATQDDPNISDREWAVREGMVAFAGYPLLVEARVVGVVAMFSRQPLTDSVLFELAPLADVIAQFIDRRRADCVLRQSEARKTAMFETALDCIISINHEGLIVEFNAASERTFGYRREDVLGRELASVIIPSAFRERHRRGLAHYLATGEGPVLNQRLELSALRADGSEFPVELTVIRIPVDGPPLFTAYLRDITERKQAELELQKRERQFGTLAESIPQLAWMANPDGYIFWYNRRWYEYTGTTFEQMEGWGWQSVHNPAVLPSVMEKWTESIATGEPFDMVFPLLGADGVFRPFLTRVLPVKDEEGRVTRWFGTNTDVTEQRRMADELRQLAAELSEADHRKNEFLAMLAHELRNPLAPLRNALQIVQLSAGDKDSVQSASELMERQVRHMVHLVDDLLDVSRITRGKIDLRRECVELAPLIAHAVETSRPAIESARHQLTVTLPAQPVYLHADRVRLAQVFSNLLNNSCKYSEPGGRIWITAQCQGSNVEVSVKDAGLGIPADMLPKIFEMFTQVDRSLERSQGGLGIGLTLVQRLVEMHEGTVSAFSEGPGRGSEFVVRLPLLVPQPRQPSSEPAVRKSASMSACRILIVDDNRDAARTLAMLLKLTGNETHTAYDGVEAVEAAGALRPDVVLLDIGLPKLNGYEVARKMREQPWGKNMVLVALTGWGQEDDRRKSREAGFNAHLVKPVEHAALVKLLADLLLERAN